MPDGYLAIWKQDGGGYEGSGKGVEIFVVLFGTRHCETLCDSMYYFPKALLFLAVEDLLACFHTCTLGETVSAEL